MRTLGRKLLPLTDLGAAPASGVSDGVGGAARPLMGEPGGAVIGVAAPAPAVGSALSWAMELVPEEDTDRPAPGAMWLMPLSRVPRPPPGGPTSMSLSSVTTVFALP